MLAASLTRIAVSLGISSKSGASSTTGTSTFSLPVSSPKISVIPGDQAAWTEPVRGLATLVSSASSATASSATGVSTVILLTFSFAVLPKYSLTFPFSL